MFNRKIYDKLVEWKNKSNGSTALLIEGARRIGKSTIATYFGEKNYNTYLLIDFSIMADETKKLFFSLEDIDVFYRNLFLSQRHSILEKGSLIIFDEIQYCPQARQLIKHLVKDGRYHFIETGSLVSIKENEENILIPSEEERISMYPMDFEEFMEAIGNKYVFDQLKEHYWTNQLDVSSQEHRVYMECFRLYLAVGGMPQVVEKYVSSKDFYEVDNVKKNILSLYEEDLRKIDNKYKTICTLVWKNIPSMLSKHSSKFIVSSLDKRADSILFQSTLDKLEESKMVQLVYRTTEASIGYHLTRNPNSFKIYFNDVGLFTAILYSQYNDENEDIYQKLILGKLESNFGMLYENLACNTLYQNGYLPYYFAWNENNNKYEIDFLINKKGKNIPIEVKSSDVRSVASISHFKEKYVNRVGKSYVIYPKSYKNLNNIFYLPIYFVNFL